MEVWHWSSIPRPFYIKPVTFYSLWALVWHGKLLYSVTRVVKNWSQARTCLWMLQVGSFPHQAILPISHPFPHTPPVWVAFTKSRPPNYWASPGGVHLSLLQAAWHLFTFCRNVSKSSLLTFGQFLWFIWSWGTIEHRNIDFSSFDGDAFPPYWLYLSDTRSF